MSGADAPTGARGIAGRRGFTLLELMIVTAMLGILAMIAFPIYRGAREKASIAALQKQLRALASAEELYFAERNTYTADTARLDYRLPDHVQVELRVAGGGAAGTGWSARLVDPDFETRCAVVYGDATAYEPAAEHGSIVCDRDA